MLAKSRRVRLEERLLKAGVTEGRAMGRLPRGATSKVADDLPEWNSALGPPSHWHLTKTLGPLL